MDTVIAPGLETSAPQFLKRTRSLVDPVLRSVIEKLPAEMRLVTGYHLGLWDQTGTPAPGGAGKAIRPALVLAACEFAGGRARDAVAAAAAVELVHNFTLLHDDVMDGDATRRNRPTAWTVFGVPDAILAGDALQAAAFRLLAESASPDAPGAVGRLAACLIELCEGQHHDCAFERRPDVGLEECCAMAEAKTGALLGCCCALGALAAQADERTVDALDCWGRSIGRAFQLVDDLLGIWGDPTSTGKPVYSDLASRKKSMPVVAALNAGTAASLSLAQLYRGEAPMTPAEQLHAAELLETAGARAWADERIAALVEQADHLLRDLPGYPARADALLSLGELIVRRDR